MKKRTIIGLAFVLLGIGLFIYKVNQPVYIDAQGIVHEDLYLIVVGYLSIMFGAGIVVVGHFIDRIRKHRMGNLA